MRPRRIVAALELRRRPADGIEAIARLARDMEAELLGLFVEDVALLHFAALPFACEVGAATALMREVDLATMERTLRASAEKFREAFAEALGRAGVPWSFRVARGALASEMLAAGTEQPGPTLLLPPGGNIDEEPCVVPLAGLTESRLRELLQGTRPVLILPQNPDTA